MSLNSKIIMFFAVMSMKIDIGIYVFLHKAMNFVNSRFINFAFRKKIILKQDVKIEKIRFTTIPISIIYKKNS